MAVPEAQDPTSLVVELESSSGAVDRAAWTGLRAVRAAVASGHLRRGDPVRILAKPGSGPQPAAQPACERAEDAFAAHSWELDRLFRPVRASMERGEGAGFWVGALLYALMCFASLASVHSSIGMLFAAIALAVGVARVSPRHVFAVPLLYFFAVKTDPPLLLAWVLHFEASRVLLVVSGAVLGSLFIGGGIGWLLGRVAGAAFGLMTLSQQPDVAPDARDTRGDDLRDGLAIPLSLLALAGAAAFWALPALVVWLQQQVAA